MASDEQGRDRQGSPATAAVHGGQRRPQPFGAVVSPVFRSSTFGFETFDEMRRYARGELREAYFYSRYANPTVAEVERNLAGLEGGEEALVTSSGSAATTCALTALCQSGDEIICCDSIYGGTVKIMTEVLGRFGVRSRFIPIQEIERLPELRGETTRLFWFESPANPINRLVDLERAAAAARRAGLFSVIDSTFATPVLQRPLSHGVDAVMHSATKYLGGHSDLTAGVLVGSKDFISRARRVALLTGATLDPEAAYLLGRGLKTLDLRVRASCDNALALARALSRNKMVARVYYPGLEDNPDYQLARKQMSGFGGGVVSIDLKGGEPEAERFFDALRLVKNASSLGGVETLVSYPLYSSHVGFSDEQLRAAGVSAATVRFAVGIEAAADIIADVEQALEKVG
ncbi:MAG TPA: aminotransferase class I/II-fold pyridoxal phosphate-dependent enzyme [Pyrinomonadaceae bacterium]|nr:aminotransferase class I/II-fold pyridoxal phosphate-dependent enzyme [Pyrinomonadaceae bacterium]